MKTPNGPMTRTLSRRTLIRRAAAFGAITPAIVAALAACGSGSGPGGTAASGARTSSAGDASMTPAGTPASPTTAGTAAAGATPAGTAWFPLKGGVSSLQGSGSSFDNPVFQTLFPIYQRQFGVKVSYQSIGSGGGIKQFTQSLTNFGATDAPLTSDETRKVNGNVIHFPIALGAVVLTYNLPGVKPRLKLDGQIVAGIYLGAIKRWNDPAIAGQNPGLSLPDTEIAVVHRSDSSGTTYIFTNWLAAQDSEWKSKVGAGKDVGWPAGIGAQGNEGVANQVLQTEGAIGFNEIAYALTNTIQYAQIKNPAGNYAMPSLQNVSAAAASAAAKFPPDLTGSILNAPGDSSYPVASFSWLIVHQQYPGGQEAKARALVNLIYWTITQGQQHLPQGYASLPAAIVQREVARLRLVEAGGQPVIPAGQ